ncbi:anti-sigma factor [Akkermansiaceae bacterium]|nr:anti-sigma factor [Akkermansiaceae bacterium]
MSQRDIQDRFEELEAGRILGDLSPEESREWDELSKAHGFAPDLSLELAAAAIEAEFAQAKTEAIPAGIADTVRNSMGKFTAQQPGGAPAAIHFPLWKRLYQSPQAAWGMAALFAMFLVANFIAKPPVPAGATPITNNPISPEKSRELLFTKAGDLIESEFGGTENYAGMSGKVVWSDSLQEGYMTLASLPPNDPSRNQYQLWIVDPARDEKPVDGGVFDIPAGKSAAVIPIRNPLPVNKPQAFVITLEQPGGVVVSKQEIVVALAKSF